MSTTTTKRSHTEAMKDAEAFRAMFPPTCYERWEFAGSLRRKRPEVGDIEHVIIPRSGQVTITTGLFPTQDTVNLLWHRLDELVASGELAKHLYGDTQTTRWGEKYRGADFRGFNHELFTADWENWGAIFCIRTGPADFSERVVTRMKDRGVYRQQGGYVVSVYGDKRQSCPDERTFLGFAGMTYLEPEQRR